MRTYTNDWRVPGPRWKDLFLIIVGLAFLVWISFGIKGQTVLESGIPPEVPSSPSETSRSKLHPIPWGHGMGELTQRLSPTSDRSGLGAVGMGRKGR